MTSTFIKRQWSIQINQARTMTEKTSPQIFRVAEKTTINASPRVTITIWPIPLMGFKLKKFLMWRFWILEGLIKKTFQGFISYPFLPSYIPSFSPTKPLNLFSSTHHVRKSREKFYDNQMTPNLLEEFLTWFFEYVSGDMLVRLWVINSSVVSNKAKGQISKLR